MNNLKIAKTLLKVAKELEAGSSRTAGAKYELTDETKSFRNHLLHRVKYNDGKLGGWIETKSNLQGNAKVLDNAMVFYHGVVKNNAVVSGNSIVDRWAEVSGNASVNNSEISSFSKVKDHAKITDSTIERSAIVCGNAKVTKSSIIDWETALIDGNAYIENSHVAGSKVTGSGKLINSYIEGTASKVEGEVRDSQFFNQKIIVDKNTKYKNNKIVSPKPPEPPKENPNQDPNYDPLGDLLNWQPGS